MNCEYIVNSEYRNAAKEVLEIIKNIDKKELNKIPNKFISFLENVASRDYEPNFEKNKELKELDLMDKTKDILTMIYRNYLCDDSEKRIYDEILRKNELEYRKNIQNICNSNNIFEKNQEQDIIKETSLVEYKEEKIYLRILRKIILFFKKHRV